MENPMYEHIFRPALGVVLGDYLARLTGASEEKGGDPREQANVNPRNVGWEGDRETRLQSHKISSLTRVYNVLGPQRRIEAC